jgi:hypothetical protein
LSSATWSYSNRHPCPGWYVMLPATKFVMNTAVLNVRSPLGSVRVCVCVCVVRVTYGVVAASQRCTEREH